MYAIIAVSQRRLKGVSVSDLDQQRFVASQYGTSARLDARVALHARYSVNDYGWFRWVYDQFDLRTGDCVLELGCGTGELWAGTAMRVPAGVRLLLTDVSQGMLDQAAARLADRPLAITLACVDAQQLPYPDGRFDVVIANHMLYHVPDRPAALAEIARVLAPGGRFYATTIGAGHMAELYAHLGAPRAYPMVRRRLCAYTETGAQWPRGRGGRCGRDELGITAAAARLLPRWPCRPEPPGRQPRTCRPALPRAPSASARHGMILARADARALGRWRALRYVGCARWQGRQREIVTELPTCRPHPHSAPVLPRSAPSTEILTLVATPEELA